MASGKPWLTPPPPTAWHWPCAAPLPPAWTATRPAPPPALNAGRSPQQLPASWPRSCESATGDPLKWPIGWMGLAMADPIADTAAAMLQAVRSAQLSNQPLAVGLADALEELAHRVDWESGDPESLVFAIATELEGGALPQPPT